MLCEVDVTVQTTNEVRPKTICLILEDNRISVKEDKAF